MSHVKTTLLALAAAAAVALAPAAQASTISYDFTVSVTSGPLNGTVESGSFSYDSSSVTPGAANSADGLLTALAFTFNGISYDASTANTGYLVFNNAGDLTNFLIGNGCNAGGCGIVAGINIWIASPGHQGFLYAVADSRDMGAGDMTFAPASVPVPEPGSLALLATAILGLGFVRRRSACA